MATYGKTAAGSTFVETEARIRARKITLTGGEALVEAVAVVRLVGSGSVTCVAALYLASDNSHVVTSSQSAVVSNTTSETITMAMSGTPAAGDYWLVIRSNPIAGGANRIEVSDEVVTDNNTLYDSLTTGGTTYPTMPTDLDTLSDDDNTHDITLSLTTSSGGGHPAGNRLPRFNRFPRF